MEEFILVKINHHKLPHGYMAAPAFHYKSFGDLKWTFRIL